MVCTFTEEGERFISITGPGEGKGPGCIGRSCFILLSHVWEKRYVVAASGHCRGFFFGVNLIPEYLPQVVVLESRKWKADSGVFSR